MFVILAGQLSDRSPASSAENELVLSLRLLLEQQPDKTKTGTVYVNLGKFCLLFFPHLVSVFTLLVLLVGTGDQ